MGYYLGMITIVYFSLTRLTAKAPNCYTHIITNYVCMISNYQEVNSKYVFRLLFPNAHKRKQWQLINLLAVTVQSAMFLLGPLEIGKEGVWL